MMIKKIGGFNMTNTILPPLDKAYSMGNYEEATNTFDWDSVDNAFSWYDTRKVNLAYEAIDRHAESERAEHIALYFEGPKRVETYSFLEMKQLSNKAANVFTTFSDLKKGDRLFIFMPRQPELYIALLGAIKKGIIVGPLFEAFMEAAVFDRLEDSEATAIVTTPELLERIPLDRLPLIEKVFIVGDNVEESAKIVDFNKRIALASDAFDLEWVHLGDGLILHYTSGSTGKPKGVLHVHNAMIQQYQTAKWVLDLQPDDIYWCTADPGWITGTAYGFFAPWLLGVSTVVYGNRFSASNWYELIETYKVTVWYSAPTAYRMLMGAGDQIVNQFDLSSLRHVLSVGEPLNPEVIKWGNEVLNTRIHDTWWMTETGAQIICNFPSMPIKPGSMGKAFPGIEVAILDEKGQRTPALTMGNLAIRKGWPAMMQSIWNNKTRFDSYFNVDDWYISGDYAYQDEDGYLWFQGRIDDVIMTSGERVGPFEIESKLLEHPAVLEAGVIGVPDEIRGEIIKAFIALNKGFEPTEELELDIKSFVKNGLAAHAAPRKIEFKDKLPKTRSGKIMRRVLKSWELDLPTGDLSSMED